MWKGQVAILEKEVIQDPVPPQFVEMLQAVKCQDNKKHNKVLVECMHHHKPNTPCN